MVSQIHYQNTNADVNEGVEVIFPSGLTGLSLALYQQGTGGGATKPATQYTLNGTNLNVPAGQSIGSGFSVAVVLTPGIMDGNGDGLALVCGGSVVQYLSYGGVSRASDGPASGTTSVNIGVSESGESPRDAVPACATLHRQCHTLPSEHL
jgi:uncharacterized protein